MISTIEAAQYLAILENYGLHPEAYHLKALGSGLIHKTFSVLNAMDEPAFVLQELNTAVFTKPEDIAHNLQILERYRSVQLPEYLLPVPLSTVAGEGMSVSHGRYFRLTSFVQGALAYDRCDSDSQAYEAARQFGQFTSNYSGLSIDMLRYTIPGFHDLPFRWKQFVAAEGRAAMQDYEDSVSASAAALLHTRWAKSTALRARIRDQYPIVQGFEQLLSHKVLKKRVTHHDTKISNVLFSESGKGICVIDLDTVMPGYFISDIGDMMRTYLSPGNEEENDLRNVYVRPEIYHAIREGYMEQMSDALTLEEKECFSDGGAIMMYMQALRFLTDYLNMDVYYGQSYEGQNFNRAANQLTLLESYLQLSSEKRI